MLNLLITAIREARDELGAALIMALPTDDQIIIGHIRLAHTELRHALSIADALAERNESTKGDHP